MRSLAHSSLNPRSSPAFESEPPSISPSLVFEMGPRRRGIWKASEATGEERGEDPGGARDLKSVPGQRRIGSTRPGGGRLLRVALAHERIKIRKHRGGQQECVV